MIKVANLKKLTVCLVIFAFWGTADLFAAKPKIPKNKAGALYHSHATGSYTLSEQGSSNSNSASANLIGFGFFYERLFLDRFSTAFKYGYGLERNLEMVVGTNTIQSLEMASYWELEFKAFIKDNMQPGFKPFLGVGYGNYTTNSTLSIIPASGSITEDQTTATIPFTVLSAGFDYTFGFGGFRLESGLTTGKRTDLESSTAYYASYDYTGAIINFSVYSFF